MTISVAGLVNKYRAMFPVGDMAIVLDTQVIVEEVFAGSLSFDQVSVKVIYFNKKGDTRRVVLPVESLVALPTLGTCNP